MYDIVPYQWETLWNKIAINRIWNDINTYYYLMGCNAMPADQLITAEYVLSMHYTVVHAVEKFYSTYI